MTKNFYGFIFDSGNKDFNNYIIFDSIVCSIKDMRTNSIIRFYYGDISDGYRTFDLEPYINRNEMCSIRERHMFSDFPFFWCMYGINFEQAKFIEKSLKKFNCYVGFTNIEIESKLITKHFWTNLINDIKIENLSVYFQDFDLQPNGFEKIFNKYGYRINYVTTFDDETFEKNGDNTTKYNFMQNCYNLGYRLNVEVRVAGGLIWDSIEKLANISYFPKFLENDVEPNNVEDCYMCIYNASQGIERLQKTLIELFLCKENCKLEDEEKTYKLLMSHNHDSLHTYIKNKLCINNNEKYNKLVGDLSKFYNYIRYNNYDADSEFNRTYFYDILCSYAKISKNNNSLSVSELENFKLNFASALGDYANLLYKAIDKLCSELNIFAYELDYTNKSAIVFSIKENENLYNKFLQFKKAKKEVLYYLAKNGKEFFSDFDEIEPLDFDKHSINCYCESIIANNYFDYYDFVNDSYDSLCKKNKEDFKTRLAFIDFIFSRDFDWSQIEEDSD